MLFEEAVLDIWLNLNTIAGKTRGLEKLRKMVISTSLNIERRRVATLNCVRKFREAASLSLEELASRVDAPLQLLCALESGESVPPVDVALRLARVFQTTVEELFFLSDESSQDEAPLVEETSDVGSAPTSVCGASKGERRQRQEEGVEENRPLSRVPAYVPCSTGDRFEDALATPLFADQEQVALFHSGGAKARRVSAPTRGQAFSSYDSKTAKNEGLASSPDGLIDPTNDRPIRFFDLFCGIGGFRFAMENVLARMRREGRCVLSCDADHFARKSYLANFGDDPLGDVEELPSDDIPEFDVLISDFSGRPFSSSKSRDSGDVEDESLFLQIARILRDKRPRAFVLENARQLTTRDSGRAFETILEVLQDELGYVVDWRALNAFDCGLPQKRERVVVVGAVDPFEIEWPRRATNRQSLADILTPEKEVPARHYASPRIVSSRKKAHKSKYSPSVWREDSSGRVLSYPYCCALRADASYNYLLVNGERRFTPLELLRLQGFPEDFKIVVSESRLRRQLGAATTVNLVERVLERFLPLVFQTR